MASWKGFWNGFGQVAAKIAIWAAENPQVVEQVIKEGKK